MKCVRPLASCLLTFLIGCQSTTPLAFAAAPIEGDMSAREAAVRAFWQLLPLPLADGEDCQGIALVDEHSVGDFAARLLSSFDSDGANHLIVEAGPDANHPEQLYVSLRFARTQGEEVWAWGFGFWLQRDTGFLASKRFRCEVAG